MSEFVTGLLAYPTIVFTLLLGVAGVYWLLVLLGFFSMDFLDGVLGIEAVDGAVDGALDGTVDGALDGAAEALDGAVDGAVDGATEGDHGPSLGLMHALGLRGVPVTVTASFAVLGAWAFTFLSMQALGGQLPASGLVLFLAATLVALVSFTASVLVTSVVLRPLRRFFHLDPAPGRSSLVGKLCTVTSSRVDLSVGQAEIDDGGSGFVAEVRCSRPGALRRGMKALVFRYDTTREIFEIAPLDPALGTALGHSGEAMPTDTTSGTDRQRRQPEEEGS